MGKREVWVELLFCAYGKRLPSWDCCGAGKVDGPERELLLSWLGGQFEDGAREEELSIGCKSRIGDTRECEGHGKANDPLWSPETKVGDSVG